MSLDKDLIENSELSFFLLQTVNILFSSLIVEDENCLCRRAVIFENKFCINVYFMNMRYELFSISGMSINLLGRCMLSIFNFQIVHLLIGQSIYVTFRKLSVSINQ